MWLGLAISLALLCVSNTVLAHDIYSGLRDRDGHLCCGGEDCKPVEATVLPNGSYYLPRTGVELSVDGAKAITYGHARRVQRRVGRREYRQERRAVRRGY